MTRKNGKATQGGVNSQADLSTTQLQSLQFLAFKARKKKIFNRTLKRFERELIEPNQSELSWARHYISELSRSSLPEDDRDRLLQALDDVADVVNRTSGMVQKAFKRLQFPASKKVPLSVICRVEEALSRCCRTKAPGLSNYEFACEWGEYWRYHRLRSGQITLRQLADLVQNLGISVNDMYFAPPYPWSCWTPGGKLVISLGARYAQRMGADRVYNMISLLDHDSSTLLKDFFSRLGISRVEVDLPRLDLTTPQTPQDHFAKLLSKAAGLIVVGSEHGNDLAKVALDWVMEGLSENEKYHFDWPQDAIVHGKKKWSRVYTEKDAGLLCIRRGEFQGKTKVVAVAAGLGPDGTFAAANALKASHEIAHFFDNGLFQETVVVPEVSRLHLPPGAKNTGERPWFWGYEVWEENEQSNGKPIAKRVESPRPR